MKIIHYISSISLKSFGTTTFIQSLCSELGKYHQVHIVTHYHKDAVVIKNCSIYFISSNLLHGMKKEWKNILNDIKPDIVHINGCWIPQCAYAQKWAKESGYKIILSPHGMLEPWIIKQNYWTKKLPALSLFQKEAIKKADIIHATSTIEKEHLSQLNYNQNIMIVPNGLDTKDLSIKSNWQRKKKILFLSRIHEKKGINLLLEAVAIKKETLKDYSIIIAGEGRESLIRKLKAQAKILDISNMVHFIGGVYGKEKWELYKDADILILPTYSENFGYVVIESLTCGTPVITTQRAPWKDLINHHCGWWVKAEVNEISHAIDDYLSLTSNELKEMGMNGRKLVEDSYSIQKTSQEMIKLYQGLL